MLETLSQIFDGGGPLIEVSCARFKCEQPFDVAYGLRFERLTVVFRAVADDDVLQANIGSLAIRSDETTADLSQSLPWSELIGSKVCWGWQLTNHQGYADGVRLEFGEAGAASCAIIELVAMASTIQVFEVERRLGSLLGLSG